jgi:hypothetical protein
MDTNACSRPYYHLLSVVFNLIQKWKYNLRFMFLTRLILSQSLSIAMETYERILETVTFLDWICDRGTTDNETVIEDAGEGFEGLDRVEKG